MGSNPGWGRSPGGGHGNPLQDSCLENLMILMTVEPDWLYFIESHRVGHDCGDLAHTTCLLFIYP